MRSLTCLLLLACTTTPTPHQARVPNIATGSQFLASGDLTFTGPTSPGTAHFDAAPVDSDTRAGGTGGFDVSVTGTDYASTAATSMAFTSTDDSTGTDYLIVADFVEDDTTGIGQVVYLIVPTSDYAPNATVALDGQDRIALFAAGDVNADAPSVAAAAVSGTITFGSDANLSAQVSATLTADFGPVDWQSVTGNDGDADAGPTTRPSGRVADGPTQLVLDPTAQIRCDGSLSGKEADFATITAADLGFASGPVTIANVDLDTISMTGDVLGPALGATTVTLTDSDSPDQAGLFVDDAARTGSGPDASSLTDAALLLDAADATVGSDVQSGFAALYQTSDGGSCEIWFDATLPGAGATSGP